jgi:Retinal tissue protein
MFTDDFDENVERYDDDYDDLVSLETLDRASPDLWPQRSKKYLLDNYVEYCPCRSHKT